MFASGLLLIPNKDMDEARNSWEPEEIGRDLLERQQWNFEYAKEKEFQ